LLIPLALFLSRVECHSCLLTNVILIWWKYFMHGFTPMTYLATSKTPRTLTRNNDRHLGKMIDEFVLRDVNCLSISVQGTNIHSNPRIPISDIKLANVM
jgi:hypothetical protein